MNDKQIWVRLDGIIIFGEQFTMNGWPNIRAVLDLKNNKDNKIDKFIALNPNKSNSKLNLEIKERIVSLIKFTANNDFSTDTSTRRTKIPQHIKDEVWETYNGNCFRTSCFVDSCDTEIKATSFHCGHNIPLSEDGEDTIENFRPICEKCNTGMGNDLTIDEWNDKLNSYYRSENDD